jgi:hypothetical protein
MRVSLLAFAIAVLMGAAPQEKPTPKFDPFANPLEEMARRAEKAAKEKRYNELKAAAEELADLSKKMSKEINDGGKDVISVRIFQDLDRAERLVRTIREKAK